MITLSNTDASRLCRWLDDAVSFYRHHATSIREQDRARLLLKMKKKIERKINNNK